MTVTQRIVENPDKNKDKESIILSLITQNKELMSLLASQQQHQQQQQQEHKEETKCLVETIQEQSASMQQTIKDIIPKIGNNNTTNNNKFNLQVFLNEDCKDAINFSEFLESIQVSIEDLENQAQLGYVGGISRLFLENMKELGVNKRPIHCTDKKRNTLYIKENNEWDKEGSREQLLHGIKVLTGRANHTLCDMKEDNPIEYSDIDSPFSTRCEDIQRNLLPGFPREATFGKVIDSISNGSVVEKEP
jgi:acetate kinase